MYEKTSTYFAEVFLNFSREPRFFSNNIIGNTLMNLSAYLFREEVVIMKKVDFLVIGLFIIITLLIILLYK